MSKANKQKRSWMNFLHSLKTETIHVPYALSKPHWLGCTKLKSQLVQCFPYFFFFHVTSFICHYSPWGEWAWLGRWGRGVIQSGCLHLLPGISAQARGRRWAPRPGLRLLPHPSREPYSYPCYGEKAAFRGRSGVEADRELRPPVSPIFNSLGFLVVSIALAMFLNDLSHWINRY